MSVNQANAVSEVAAGKLGAIKSGGCRKYFVAYYAWM